jgi:hypothetical protein
MIAQESLRICMVGNSHLAALRDGWKIHYYDRQMLLPTWFGAPRDALGRLRLADGKLVTSSQELKDSLAWTSGGLNEIDLKNYDAFALVGLGLTFTTLARLYRDCRAPGQSRTLGFRRLISHSVFEAALKGQIHNSLALVLSRVIRRASEKPIYLICDPLPAENARDGKEAKLWRHLEADEDGADLLKRFTIEVELAAREASATVIWQPKETRAGRLFTRGDLRKGAMRLRINQEVEFDDEEYSHLGPQYGVAMLSALDSAVKRDRSNLTMSLI